MEPGPKIEFLKDEPISAFLPYASLIFVCASISIVCFANVLEHFVFPWLYPTTWTYLGAESRERRRRSFTYHHVAVFFMSILFVFAIYPMYLFIIGEGSNLATAAWRGRRVHITTGDLLLVVAQVYCAYYVFELAFRVRFISGISAAHHFGLLIITQTALVLSVNFSGRRSDATIEFYMCIVWGAFDVVAEIPLHTAMIYWRVHRSGDRRRLMHIAYSCYLWQVVLSVGETGLTIYLLKVSWARWVLAWRIVTPVVFTLWIATQIYGATLLLKMGNEERRALKSKAAVVDDAGPELKPTDMEEASETAQVR
ncbi:hypothetical protein B0H16DRAFT_1315200 [Mycena metata]|uniref:TLC domain-containing protein n=1 Tax=Mycena metata TaxID=1033252 RepID=A0AAD7J3X1_9AGAR|nr:hypothetical protein B0H16DRAFT_1315200 [Mycena metata]